MPAPLKISAQTVSEFSKVFSGHTEYYGNSIPTGKTKDGKLEMNSYTKTVSKGDKSLSVEMYRDHLEGKTGLGIAPIKLDNSCSFGVIDIDDYSMDLKQFVSTTRDYNLPFHLFRSKSGGLHVYVFFSDEVNAKKLRDIMKRFLIIFGLPAKTEIFPKQDKLIGSAAPNWINLPYFGGTDSYMYDDTLEPRSLEQALFRIKQYRISWEAFQETYDGLPLSDGPMCLQSLYVRSADMTDGDGRNEYLFNMGIYYKLADPSNFQEAVLAANEKMAEPKLELDIINQIINPIEKKTYSYKCGEHPLCDNCYKDLCKIRKFGKEGDEVSSLSFEGLKQVLTDPPYYVWTVNGINMEFYKESDLRDQRSFGDQCMRHLHLVPNIIKAQRWTEILNKAFSEITTEEVDEESDISPGATLISLFKEYVRTKPRSTSNSQVLSGFIIESDNHYWFKSSKMLEYLRIEKGFKHFADTEIRKRLKTFGVELDKQKKIGPGKNAKLWTINTSKIDTYEDDDNDDDVVSLDEFKKKEQEF